MFCGICGHENRNEVKYCIACGKPLIKPENVKTDYSLTEININQKGKIRNFWMLLLLSVITGGIYLLYWYYINLKEIQKVFNNSNKEKLVNYAFKSLKTLFIFITTITGLYILLYFNKIIRYADDGEFLKYWYSLPYMIHFDSISHLIEMFFLYYFIKVVEVSQIIARIKTLNFTFLFIMVISTKFLSILALINYDTDISLLTVISGITKLVYLYMLQKEINRLWLLNTTEAHELNPQESSTPAISANMKQDDNKAMTIRNMANNISSSSENVIISSKKLVNNLYSKTKDVASSQLDVLHDKQVKRIVMNYIVVRKKIIVTVLLITIVTFISLFAYKNIESNNLSEKADTTNNTVSQDNNISEIDLQPETNTSLTDFIQLKPSFIVASSTLSSEDNIYIPESAIDDDIETTWVEGASDDGIGQSLTITYDQKVRVSRLEIINGYSKVHNQYGDLYYKNNRIKSILVKFDDESVTFNLDDGIKDYQQLIPTKNYVTRSITITILGIYRGSVSNWHDTCLSELKVYGNPQI